VPRNRFHFAQQPPRLRLEHRDIEFLACKPLHGVERLKEIDDDKFHLKRSIAPQHIASAITGSPAQAWQHCLVQ
jgi:hypothetical protein